MTYPYRCLLLFVYFYCSIFNFVLGKGGLAYDLSNDLDTARKDHVVLPYVWLNINTEDGNTLKDRGNIACYNPYGIREDFIEPTVAGVRWYPSPVPITKYTLQWREAGSTTWPNSLTAITIAHSLTGLTPGTAYEWRVSQTCSTQEESEFTIPRSFTAQCSAPISLWLSSVTPNSANIYWAGTSSFRYQVRWRLQGSTDIWEEKILSEGVRQYEITGLTSGNTYEWQLKMLCGDSISIWSALAIFTTACISTSIYNYATFPTQVDVGWGSVGSGVSYFLQWRVAGSVDWPNSLTTTQSRLYITGLTPNTAYEARMRVVCGSVLAQQYSNVINFTTLICDAPTGMRETFMDSQMATVAWDWGQAVNYKTQWRETGTVNWLYAQENPNTAIQLVNLSPGKGYEWRVQRYCTTTESSTFTVPRSFTTQCYTPKTVYKMYVYSNSVRVGWEGEAGYLYTIRWKILVGTDNWQEALSKAGTVYDLNGLTNNLTYECQVRKFCQGAWTDWSSSLTFTTQCTPVSRLNIIRPVGSSDAYLYWEGREDIETFVLQWRPKNQPLFTYSSTTTKPFTTITNLTPSTIYEAWVIVGCGDRTWATASNVVNFTTTDCKTPTDAGETAIGLSSAQLQWYSSSNYTQYEVQWREVGEYFWFNSAVVSQTQFLLSRLLPDVRYEWRVRQLCTYSDYSNFSSTRTFTTECSPPVGQYVGFITSTGVSVGWAGLPDATYQVRWRSIVNGSSWNEEPVLVKGISTTLTGLSNGNTYEWQVRLICGIPLSTWSNSYSFTTQCNPISLFLRSPIGPSTMELSWGLRDINTSFRLQWRLYGYNQWSELVTNEGKMVLRNLTPGMYYEARVQAVCRDGNTSQFSYNRVLITPSQCTNFQSIRNGSWSDPTIWSCGRVPTRGDFIEILHAITVETNLWTMAGRIRYGNGGYLHYKEGSKLLMEP